MSFHRTITQLSLSSMLVLACLLGVAARPECLYHREGETGIGRAGRIRK